MALAGTRQLRLQGRVPVHAHRTKGITGFEGREGANGIGGGIGVGGGSGNVNGDGDGDGAGTGTGVKANEGTQDGNGDGSADGAGTGTGVETRGRTQDGSGDGSGDGNESSSRDGNGDEDGNGGGSDDGIREGGGESKKRNKNCTRDQALSFRTRHHLCRQKMTLMSTRQLRSQGLAPVHTHRTEGVTESEGREGANGVEGRNEDGNEVGGGNGDLNGDGDGAGAGTEVEEKEGALVGK